MKKEECRNIRGIAGFLKFFFILHSAFFLFAARAAEDFGDVSVAPGAIYTGNTFHGYAEMRVALENRSLTKAHAITLVFPNYSYNNGNSIGKLTRTVKLGPGAREIVSLLQPPLAAQGDTSIRVLVDGNHEGEVRAPNANNHCNMYSGRGEMPAVFVSRSLDFDAVNNLMQPDGVTPGAVVRGPTSPASEAVGSPGAFRTGRKDLSAAWMPDTRLGGNSHWLEVDYAPTQTVEKVVIHSVQTGLRMGSITLVGNSGTNLLTVPMSAAKNISDRGHGFNVEFNFSPTAEPVKTVRIEFGTVPPTSVAVDGVQISGASGSQWAIGARASSENTSRTTTTSYAPRYPGRTAADDVESLRAESPVSDWSENWLGYSPFDAVVISAADLGAMPPAVFAALGDYLYAGGNVMLLGKTELPDAWHAAQKKKLRGGSEMEVGFGNCFLFGASDPAALDSMDIQRVREVVRSTARYWQSLPGDSGAANAAMPVVENLKIPVRGIVVIMLAFIIVIGPVNIIWLSRRNRRTWMLWTIPAISFATTLLVFAYSLLREGITPDTRIAGVTLLDQASHRAATIGVEAFYCPLTPSGGLHFDYGTEATPLVSRGYGSGTSREVDWTQSQNFTHGWISARVPAHFHLRKPETRRERIQIVNENGKLQVVNSLGANIKALLFADADMKLYEARNVGAGQKGGLVPSPSVASGKSGAEGLLRDIGFTANLDTAFDNAGKSIQPNTYIAVLDGNPFLENALASAASAKRTKASAVVFGILEPTATK